MIDCLIGFDGYIDELYTVVSSRKDLEDYTRIEKIEEFGNRVLGAAHRSADIEIIPLETTFGGNAPILSNALASLGYRTACIGNMDNSQNENPFAQMHLLCEKISTGQVNRTIALEFADGKIMLGNLCGNTIGWEEIKQKAGIDRLKKLTRDCRLIGFVNWSGIPRMNEIMKSFYEELLFPLGEEERAGKNIFLDLADVSARSDEDLQKLYDFLRSAAPAIRITIGMNENEAMKIGKSLDVEESDLVQLGDSLRSLLGVYQVVIHTHHFIVGCRAGQTEKIENQSIKFPVRSTGAGDHFNAGFCMGILENRSLKECMKLGQTVALQFVSTGTVIDREQLKRYCK